MEQPEVIQFGKYETRQPIEPELATEFGLSAQIEPSMHSAVTEIQPSTINEADQQGNIKRVSSALAGVVLSTSAILGSAQLVESVSDGDGIHAVAYEANKPAKKLRNCPTIIAHRGSVGKMRKPGKNFTTENTVWSARRAQLWGADGAEFDNRDSAQGTTYLMHDVDVRRTTDGYGPIGNKSDTRIERLHTPDGSDVPKYSDGEYLEDILSTGWANNRNRPMRLKANILNFFHQIEVKKVKNIVKFVRTAHEVIGRMQGVNPSKKIMWTTDKIRVARKIHSLDKEASIGRIYFSGRPSPQTINTMRQSESIFDSFNVHEATVEPRWVKQAHRAGMKVLARTVNNLREARKVIRARVDTIVTDNVPVINAWNLERKGICRAVRKNMPVITPPQPTPTPTPSPSPSETITPTPTQSPSETISPTATSSPSSSETISDLPSVSSTPTETTVSSSTPVSTATVTP